MPFDCQFRATHGQDACVDRCPTTGTSPTFVFARVERSTDLPPVEPHTIDIAVLDMHHGWPNLGHDAIVHGVQNAVCDLQADLAAAGLSFRVLSYDVRRGAQIPEAPGGRHMIYIGTGGPGHLDPARNDGVSPGSQGIREDPRWERRLFGLFPPPEREGRIAVLICAPFGQEVVRSHRLFRVLSDRLARTGIAVLRFVPYGTGDSPGEDIDGVGQL